MVTGAKREDESVSIVKCPNCGADLKFDPNIGALACEYCGTNIRPQKQQITSSRNFYTERAEGEVEAGTSIYGCPNCGGEAQISDFSSTIECPFCGATNIVKTDKLKGLKPDTILPFLISRENALSVGQKWIKKRLFAPRKLKKNFSADHFNGVYVPSFIFQTDTNSRYEGKLGEYYFVEIETSKGIRTERRVRWFAIRGHFDKYYRNVVVQASSAVSQPEMNKILPYDLDRKEHYRKEYLAGFAAERYSSSLDNSFDVAKAMVAPDIKKSILSKYKYDVIGYINIDTAYTDTRFNYTLLPIWICGYNYHDKLYHYIVNGRTGRATGAAPVSALKVALTVLFGIAVVIGLVLLLGLSGPV